MIWTAAVVPLLTAMEAAGVTSPEHPGKHWKQLYALPIPRWKYFVAKAAVCGLLTVAGFLVFGASVLLLGVLRGMMLDLQMGSSIPWGLMLNLSVRACLASSALIAAQLWLSFRFLGFAIPVGASLAGAVIVAVLGQVWGWAAGGRGQCRSTVFRGA
jgi:ABC-2 type transport system permease protein